LSIYKPCDIRGDAETQLSPALYRNWGRSLGLRLISGSSFMVGGDVRVSTPQFLAALIEGLCDAGLAVTNLGILPTPMIYFAAGSRNAAGCAVVTASHNPPHINGLKWMLGDLPPSEEDVQALRTQAEGGIGTVGSRSGGSLKNEEVSSEYREWLEHARHPEDRLPVLTAVLDPGDGCWAGRALPYLQQVFPEMRFSAIHDRPDGTFPHRSPDCSHRKNLSRLADAVCERRADLGIAFDGDGDRAAFVDDRGTVLTAEQATWMLLQSFGRDLEGRSVILDIKFSDRMAEAARALGAVPVAERSGHAFIRTRMMQTGAVFGAEISGHYFYDILRGGDDGLFSAVRMIRYLAQTGRQFSALREACPAIFMTPDLRLAVEDRQAVIEQVRATFARYPQRLADGVRVDFPDGWVLLRSSVTEPKLTLRFEGTSPKGLDAVVRRFCAHLPALGGKLYEEYQGSTRGVRP
jgi:phosphomannomutase / phosphoglucomutase